MLTRIAVLVSGGGTNLQALLDAQAAGILHSGKIVLVVSNHRDAYALTRAEQAGVTAFAAERKDYPDAAAWETAVRERLQAEKIDLVILAGFMSILSADFIAAFPRRIINVHPSLIPSFCGKGFYGLKVHQAALDYGVKVTGATVHFVNEIPDGGEIICQKAVRIREGDTPQRLQKRVMRQAEWKILPEAAEKVSAQLAKERKLRSEKEK